MQNVKVVGLCWVWTGSRRGDYGRYRLPGKDEGSHRVSYSKCVGPLVSGLALDHLCRNPACVRPDHLEQVTDRVNTLRGISPAAINAAKSHCQNGHEFSGRNLIMKSGEFGPQRLCRTCRNADSAKRQRALPVEVKAARSADYLPRKRDLQRQRRMAAKVWLERVCRNCEGQFKTTDARKVCCGRKCIVALCNSKRNVVAPR